MSIPRLRSALPLAAALVGIAAAGCGGRKGTLTVTLVTPLGVDPFAGAARVHIKVGDPPIAEQTVGVVGGRFSADLSFKPPSGDPLTGVVLVEALAADGAVIARGSTPGLGFVPVDEGVAVWVAPVGRASVFPGSLARPRSRLAAAELPGLGALLAGGVAGAGACGSDGSGEAAVADVELLGAYTLTVASVQALPQPRVGAVAIPVVQSGAQVGDVLLAGGSLMPGLLVFDPSGAAGSWSSLASDASLARNDAATALLTDGTTLLTGGTGAAGAPLATATIVSSAGSVSAAPIAAAMASARGRGHSATATHVPEGDGALLVGGGAPPEYFVSTSRTFLRPPHFAEAVTAIAAHTATALPSGQVLVLGGLAGSPSPVATSAAWLVDAVAGTATVPAMPLLSTPRACHTATLVGATVLACGGTDDRGEVIASCDVIDVSGAPRLMRTIALGGPRTGHVALMLPQGIVLLAGGGDGGSALASLEIYTP